ncbi:Ferric enterobactin transport ATP-binding protein FepC [bioreactor metagenome]|uniref:Ferric enterobactin transport ATP-binding protein FepC n=1 Tax=bioreactor metagenome TaxID=1076179 RepID=A0A645HLI1_9ZZZZ
MKKLNKEKNTTIITILHDLNLAVQYSDEIFLLSDGKLITHGNPQDVLTKEIIDEVYNIEVDMVVHPSTGKPYIIPVFNELQKTGS